MGGATAVNQATTIGSLEVGKKADLIVLDTRKPHLTPGGRILSTWVHNGHASDVEATMVDGEFLMRDRKILTVDETDLVAQAAAVSDRVWGRILDSGPLVLPRGQAAQRRAGNASRAAPPTSISSQQRDEDDYRNRHTRDPKQDRAHEKSPFS